MESLLPVKNSRSAIVIEPWGVMLFRFSFVSGYSGRSYVVQLPSLESDHQEAERDSFSMLTTLHLITRRWLCSHQIQTSQSSVYTVQCYDMPQTLVLHWSEEQTTLHTYPWYSVSNGSRSMQGTACTDRIWLHKCTEWHQKEDCFQETAEGRGSPEEHRRAGRYHSTHWEHCPCMWEVCVFSLCRMYTTSHAAGNTAYDVRYWMFCQKRQKSECLPPTSDSLHLHIQRANCQSFNWKQSLHAQQALPEPDGHGWMATDDGTQPLLISIDPAP